MFLQIRLLVAAKVSGYKDHTERTNQSLTFLGSDERVMVLHKKLEDLNP